MGIGRCPHCKRQIDIPIVDDALEMDDKKIPFLCIHCSKPVYIHTHWSWRGRKNP